MLKPKASLIIAFYNNTVCLELIFKALSIQTESNFEVIIADDGSKQEAIDFIYTRRESLPFTVKHVWHEDKGFRKTRILNKAILDSNSDYLIIIDGDCIPQTHFIEDHLTYAEHGRSLSGRRVELPEKYNNAVLTSASPGAFFSDHKWDILSHYFFTKGSDQLKGRHVENGLRFAQPWQQAFVSLKKPKAILGCNFSLYKDDLLKVNGFDNRYDKPTIGEDTDIDFRLNLCGIKNKSLRYLANQIHMYHPLLSRKETNYDIFLETKEKMRSWTPDGINELY